MRRLLHLRGRDLSTGTLFFFVQGGSCKIPEPFSFCSFHSHHTRILNMINKQSLDSFWCFFWILYWIWHLGQHTKSSYTNVLSRKHSQFFFYVCEGIKRLSGSIHHFFINAARTLAKQMKTVNIYSTTKELSYQGEKSWS